MLFYEQFMEAPVEPFKIRVKVGNHEFEAEGSQEIVERQFQLFKEMVSTPTTPESTKKTLQLPADGTEPNVPEGGNPDGSDGNTITPYKKLFSEDDGRLSLQYLPEGNDRDEKAVLLLLFGHKLLFKQDTVLGGRLVKGLQQSGLKVNRIDHALDAYIGGPSPSVLQSGIRRGKNYRLTNVGVVKAKTIAEELSQMMD
jgi:hypothetical protein